MQLVKEQDVYSWQKEVCSDQRLFLQQLVYKLTVTLECGKFSSLRIVRLWYQDQAHLSLTIFLYWATSQATTPQARLLHQERQSQFTAQTFTETWKMNSQYALATKSLELLKLQRQLKQQYVLLPGSLNSWSLKRYKRSSWIIATRRSKSLQVCHSIKK